MADLSRRALLVGAGVASAARGAIDRRALVRRHNPMVRRIDPLAPLSVGNGRFAFTADVTGLQSFPDACLSGIPLCTQSAWGWHTAGLQPGPFRLAEYDSYGRKVGYPTRAEGQRQAYEWLRRNPHRLNLGRIGLELDGIGGVADIDQVLDLWTGILTSRFRCEGSPIRIRTCCDPDADAVAVEIESQRPIAVKFEFPYGSPAIDASDWKRPEAHTTTVLRQERGRCDLARRLDNDRYFVAITWEGAASFERRGPHSFVLRSGETRLAFSCAFSPDRAAPAAGDSFHASETHWARFWSRGGAAEFEGSRDRRAHELERRVVLSQYLTAIQCAGPHPPQESGLTCNSWYGKFHLEMHWWHAVHFALWGRLPLLDRSLDWYRTILPAARRTAAAQGYAGARWPKMTDPSGRESPSPIGPLLIWQQPHPIYYAEVCYRARPSRETLERFREVVFETAAFMASYAHWHGQRYVLGPPVIPAQENHRPLETWNPAYELAYWRWGLAAAQRWRERLGLARDKKWDGVRARLSPLPVRGGVYLAHENCPDTFTAKNYDHPSMLAALGVLPGDGVDREIMRATLKRVMKDWRWAETWGWDFPMTAMTAARLGEPRIAVNALMMEAPKNRYLANGHNWQRDGLPLYLPGNGGLLAAVAMMAAGWEGYRGRPVPGFPEDGSWHVRWEGLSPML